MDRTKDSIERAQPERLARVMELSGADEEPWTDDQLKSALALQMEAPLQYDLGTLTPEDMVLLRKYSDAERLLLSNLRQLLEHAHPPLALLEQTKDYAKVCLAHPDSPLPRDVARMIYYLCLAAALARWGRRLSRLGDEELRGGLDWAAGRSWLDPASKKLLASARRLL